MVIQFKIKFTSSIPGEGKGYPLHYSCLENSSPWGPKVDTTERLSLTSSINGEEDWNDSSVSGNIHLCILTYCYFIVVYLLSCIWLFCNSMDCSLPDSSVHGISQANTRVDCYSLLQGIFPTQELKPHLLH